MQNLHGSNGIKTMKTFTEFLTESRTNASASAIEKELRKEGIGFKRKDNIMDVVFTLKGSYKIVTDGNVIDLKQGSKIVDSWDNKGGAASKAIDKYMSMTE